MTEETPECGWGPQAQSVSRGEPSKTIDESIAARPEGIQPLLQQVRDTLCAALPGAQERISWRMPTYWERHNLIHFAAFRQHIGL